MKNNTFGVKTNSDKKHEKLLISNIRKIKKEGIFGRCKDDLNLKINKQNDSLSDRYQITRPSMTDRIYYNQIDTENSEKKDQFMPFNYRQYKENSIGRMKNSMGFCKTSDLKFSQTTNKRFSETSKDKFVGKDISTDQKIFEEDPLVQMKNLIEALVFFFFIKI